MIVIAENNATARRRVWRAQRKNRYILERNNHYQMKPKPKNPFSDVSFANITMTQRKQLAGHIQITIAVTDPKLEFALKRQAKAAGGSVEEYGRAAIISMLESDEDYNQDRIDTNPGMVIARGSGDADPGISVSRR
jgi:hypothetical protein